MIGIGWGGQPVDDNLLEEETLAMRTERCRYGRIDRVIVVVVAGEGVENCDDREEEDEKPTMSAGAPGDLVDEWRVT